MSYVSFVIKGKFNFYVCFRENKIIGFEFLTNVVMNSSICWEEDFYRPRIFYSIDYVVSSGKVILRMANRTGTVCK
jgi:hypothetical protein